MHRTKNRKEGEEEKSKKRGEKKAEPKRVTLEDIAKRGEIKINYVIRERRESTASVMAIVVMITFIFLVLTPIIAPDRAPYVDKVLEPVYALLGMAFGFYFSQKRLLD